MQTALATAASDDRDIIDFVRSGEHERAFRQLLDRYESKIFRLCCALLRDRTRAEDAAQESLVRIWKNLGRYDERASLSTWIYAITRNRCWTALERQRDQESLSDPYVLGAVDQLPAAEQEVEDERTGLLREIIELLPERLRRTLVLYYYEERSTSEVAAMLGCPEGTVKTHLFRARAALVEQLKRRGLDDPALWLESVP
jgi:RNA polymerase sigma-70 factor (ECF subfamily)